MAMRELMSGHRPPSAAEHSQPSHLFAQLQLPCLKASRPVPAAHHQTRPAPDHFGSASLLRVIVVWDGAMVVRFARSTFSCAYYLSCINNLHEGSCEVYRYESMLLRSKHAASGTLCAMHCFGALLSYPRTVIEERSLGFT